jgi:hypothetical protein
MDLDEVAARLEIADLLARYSYAIDFRQWDELDAMFTDDAVVDYTATGGVRGSVAEIKAFVASAFAGVHRSQHLMGSMAITVDGAAGTATARTMCHNPMVFAGAGGQQDPGRLAYFGIWYHDRLVRTDAGWRIAERTQEQAYAFLPEGNRFQIPPS